jgi:hypothetical protein
MSAQEGRGRFELVTSTSLGMVPAVCPFFFFFFFYVSVLVLFFVFINSVFLMASPDWYVYRQS